MSLGGRLVVAPPLREGETVVDAGVELDFTGGAGPPKQGTELIDHWLYEQWPVPYELGRLPREPAGTARPADRRTAHVTCRRRLSLLLHPAPRPPKHQLTCHPCLGGISASPNAARDR